MLNKNSNLFRDPWVVVILLSHHLTSIKRFGVTIAWMDSAEMTSPRAFHMNIDRRHVYSKAHPWMQKVGTITESAFSLLVIVLKALSLTCSAVQPSRALEVLTSATLFPSRCEKGLITALRQPRCLRSAGLLESKREVVSTCCADDWRVSLRSLGSSASPSCQQEPPCSHRNRKEAAFSAVVTATLSPGRVDPQPRPVQKEQGGCGSP